MNQHTFEQAQQQSETSTLTSSRVNQQMKRIVSRREIQRTQVVWQNKTIDKSYEGNLTITISAASQLMQNFAIYGRLRTEPSVFRQTMSELLKAPPTLDVSATMLDNFTAHGVVRSESRPFGKQVSDFLK